MSVLILHRHLFAPAYTETQYTPDGNPQTTTLKSEVSSGQQTATKQLPSAWEVRRLADPVEMASPPKGLFLLPENQGRQQEKPGANLLFPKCALSFAG